MPLTGEGRYRIAGDLLLPALQQIGPGGEIPGDLGGGLPAFRHQLYRLAFECPSKRSSGATPDNHLQGEQARPFRGAHYFGGRSRSALACLVEGRHIKIRVL